jgi:hypothetical protein
VKNDFSFGEPGMKKLWPAWALVIAGSLAASAQEADARPDTQILAEQYLLVGTATRGCGESQVAVNPLNPNQIAVAAMCQLHQQEGKFEHNELAFERTPRATITEFVITRDRGLTWTVVEDPMRAYLHRYRCLDPFATFAADGTMILGCEAHFPTALSPADELNEVSGAKVDNGGSAIIWSTDGGRTFSDPVQVISSYMPKEILGPYVAVPQEGSTGDGPEIKTDRSTGKLYINGSSPVVQAGLKYYQTIVRMSKDRGRDWGMVYAFDSPEWPGSGSSFDVAKGILGIAYTAIRVPSELKAKCPCWVFGASTDDGKTFERHLVPAPGPTGPVRGPFGMWVTADPSKRGKFALLARAPSHIDAYVTDDAGKTWAPPVSVGVFPSKQVTNVTAAFNSSDALAVSWRVIDVAPDTPLWRGSPLPAYALTVPHVFADLPDHFEMWSAVSRDGGKTFSEPLKVSTAPSPGVSHRRNMSNHGNDFTSVDVDDDFVHMTWFDDRAEGPEET